MKKIVISTELPEEKIVTGEETLKLNLVSRVQSVLKSAAPRHAAKVSVAIVDNEKRKPVAKAKGVLMALLFFFSLVTSQAAITKWSSYTVVTNVANDDQFTFIVKDTNAPTGFKTRSIKFSSLRNAFTNNVTVTNIDNSTNIVGTNIVTSLTNILISLTNGGTIYLGDTNGYVGIHNKQLGTTNRIAFTTNGIEFHVGTNSSKAFTATTTGIESTNLVLTGSSGTNEVRLQPSAAGTSLNFKLKTATLQTNATIVVGRVAIQRQTNSFLETWNDDDGSWGNVGLVAGHGSPNGVMTAGVGSIYINLDGGASTTLYIKTSGTGNTGWTAK